MEIYRKAFKDIGDLVIIQESSLSVAEVSSILPREVWKEDGTNYFNIRIEVQFSNAKKITLATLLECDMKKLGKCEVLDALFDNGKFVIATVHNGNIIITQIRQRYDAPIVASVLRGWTKVAALVEIDHTIVNVKLNLTEGKLIEVEVDDLRPNSRQHTRFIQEPNEWKFQKVRAERK